MINIEEFKRKDAELRELILSDGNHPITFNGDYFLVKSIILSQTELLKLNHEPSDIKERVLTEYPYIFLYEWEVVKGMSQFGKGDLVFTEGKGNFLVVEVKELSPFSGRNQCVKRRKARRMVEKQTMNYMEAFKKVYPEAISIKGIAIAGDEWYFLSFENLIGIFI